jgi:hypothetical protein
MWRPARHMARWRPNQPTPSSQGVYALVAAVGEQFSVVSEVQSTGSHLSPYRRRTIEVPNNILNRLALHGLDKEIANIDRDSKRIYMVFPAAQMAGIAPSQHEGVAISAIVAELEKLPQRLEWGRIVMPRRPTGHWRSTAWQGSCRDLAFSRKHLVKEDVPATCTPSARTEWMLLPRKTRP